MKKRGVVATFVDRTIQKRCLVKYTRKKKSQDGRGGVYILNESCGSGALKSINQ